MPDSITQLETVNVSRNGAAATIELNRPQALNAWNAQFGADLLAAVMTQLRTFLGGLLGAILIVALGLPRLIRRRHSASRPLVQRRSSGGNPSDGALQVAE